MVVAPGYPLEPTRLQRVHTDVDPTDAAVFLISVLQHNPYQDKRPSNSTAATAPEQFGKACMKGIVAFMQSSDRFSETASVEEAWE